MSERSRNLWRHNAFIGNACMMQAQARAIGASASTSETAKALAREINRLARELEANLRNERIDK